MEINNFPDVALIANQAIWEGGGLGVPENPGKTINEQNLSG